MNATGILLRVGVVYDKARHSRCTDSWDGIMPSLDKHCLLSPVASYPAGRVMRIPIIYVISPFTGEVSDFGVELLYSPVFVCIGRMGEKDRVYFMAACLAVATGVTIRIRIFLCY